jgi:predicted O-methyltransferase YrrM
MGKSLRESVRARGVSFHPETLVPSAERGAGRPYTKTFDFAGAVIDPYHAHIANARVGRPELAFGIDLGIEGYLASDEALKLYELAFFSSGDVLELGTYKGLSTSIIACALRNRGSGRLDTCDIDKANSAAARLSILFRPGRFRVRFNVSDATQFLDSLIAERRKFSFVFIDHWHGYKETFEAATRLPELLQSGGFAMFHDYNDASGLDPAHPHQVYQAVADTIAADARFHFCCVVASSVVFQFC